MRLCRSLLVSLLVLLTFSALFTGQASATQTKVTFTRYVQSVDLATKTVSTTFQAKNNTNQTLSCKFYSQLSLSNGISDSIATQKATLYPGTNYVTVSHAYQNGDATKTMSVYCWDEALQPISNPLRFSVAFKQTVTKLTLNRSEVSLILAKKQTQKLTYTLSPAGQADPGVTFQSSIPSVATVDANGLITPKSAGKTIITVMTKDRSAYARCTVTVISDVTRLTLNQTKITLEKNTQKSVQLKATVTPKDAPDQTVTFQSSNTKVAKVNANGLVTYVGAGTATITATTGDQSAKATCKVTAIYIKPNVTQVTLGNRSGKTFQLSAAVKPDTAPYNQIVYQSNNTKVAKVDKNGLITYVGPGKASIAIKSGDGQARAVCDVTCVAVTLNKTSVTLGSVNNPKFRLKPTVLPNEAATGAVQYKTSNKAVVKVSSKGLIQYVGPGKATVSVISPDGSAKATCKVTAVGVTLNHTTLALGNGSKLTHRLTATVQNGTDGQTVTFQSSDATIAKVSKKGLVKFIAPGTATVTAVTDDGLAAATCTVDTVAITLKKTAVTLGGNHGTSYTVKATVTPEKEAYTALAYQSSDPAVATISSKGVIRWVSKGSAVITVKTKGGEAVATCNVTTLKLPKAIKVSKTKVTMWDYGQYRLKATVTGINKPKVTWKSSNQDVVTVSDSGIIHGVSKGKATVTAKCGSLTAKCTVTVHRESDYIGAVAAHFESKDKPGTIYGSGTGKCYGCFQLYAGSNGPKAFYEWLIDTGFNTAIGKSLKKAHQKDGGKDKIFGSNFDAKWKSLATRKEDQFRSCQMAYTIEKYYKPLAERLAKDLNFYADNYGLALKSAILSRAVQHGTYGAFNRFKTAFESMGGFKGKTEKQIIKAVYKECGKAVSKKPAAGAIAMTADSDIAKEHGLVGKYMKYYYDCSPSMQAGVWLRLNVTEPNMLYAMIKDPPVKITK